MKILFLSLVFGFLFLVIQTALLSFFFPPYLIPDLILVLVFYLGAYLHSWKGVPAAFSLGYLADTFAGGIIGINAFSLTSVFLILYLLSKRIEFNILPLRIAGLIAAGIMKGLIVVILLRFTDPQREVFYIFFRSVIPNVLVTAAVGPFFLRIFERVKID